MGYESMEIYKDESGRTFRVSSNIDLSDYTELTIIFTDPDGVIYNKTTDDGVVLGVSNVTDDDLGALLANQYVEYDVEVGLFSKAGRWCLQLLYTNTELSPVENLYGSISRFIVKERC